MERLDAFMARANADYYARQDPFTDFTTAPEISQVFGELLGLWAAIIWQSAGSPAPVLLAEAGPGRGTLMADALRAIASRVPDFATALHLHLVENSPRLRAEQAAKLADATWHDTFDTLPDGPLIVLANEFLDALPIRQFVRRVEGWAERFVADGAFVEQPCAPIRREAAAGEIVEMPDAAGALISALAARLVAQGGAALFIDYGPETSAPGDSLQGLRAGKPTDPLADPGGTDLTAHVDFAAIAAAARQAGASVFGPIPQGIFLTRLGLFQRTGVLARTLPPAQGAALLDGARRLAEPDQMGRLFKVLAVCHPGVPTPPGFA